jgi:hypothetical protein
MRKPAVAALTIIVCAALLAACGDSSTTTTKTATVPTGNLGSVPRAAVCSVEPPPNRQMFTILTITTNIDCHKANTIAREYARYRRYAGQSCWNTNDGNITWRAECRDKTDSDYAVFFTWNTTAT